MRTLARLIGCAVIGTLILLGTAKAASADIYDPEARTLENGDVETRAARLELGEPGKPTRSSGGTVSCSYLEVGEELIPFDYGGVSDQLVGFKSPGELIEGWWYYVICTVNGETQSGRFFLHPG